MSIDTSDLIKNMLAAATGAAKGHAADLKTYLEARAKLIADGIIQLAADRATNQITDDDVKFSFQQIKESEATSLLAIDATLKAAAQDAINAILAVASDTLNKAVGFALL
jgi:sulfur relay (sulfurtransferase) DsrF/TusC family protein